jgi:hypothetical protein
MNRVQPTLESIAREKNWKRFGLQAAHALSDHASYGFTRPQDLLRRLAELRGQTVLNVRNTIRAAEFMEDRFPLQEVDQKSKFGFSNVLQLIKLKEMEHPRFNNLAALVFSGKLTQRALGVMLDEYKAASYVLQVKWSARSAGGRRSREYELGLMSYLQKNVERLFGRPKACVQPGRQIEPVPADFVLTERGKPVLAVEIKHPRVLTNHRLAVESLGVCMLLQRTISEVWLVSAPDWRKHVEAVSTIANQLHIEGIGMAIYDHDAKDPDGPEALQVIRRPESADACAARTVA